MKNFYCQAALWAVVLAGCSQSGNAPVAEPAATSEAAPAVVDVANSDDSTNTDAVLVTLKLPGMT